MAVNKVDYEVLTSGVSVYSNQAGALDDVINSLVQMNGQLQDGWTNQTAVEELGEKATVIATGGLAKSIVPYCKEDVILDDDLLLKGLLWVYKKNS